MGEVVSINAIERVILEEKEKGRRIVCANGCFDIIHVGHIRYLRAAKELGDILVVALNSDISVKKIKGDSRPILEENDRAQILAAMEMVDYVVLFDEETAENILKTIKPDIQAKGSDYTQDTVPEKHLVGKYIGEIAIAGDPKDHSTKDIIKHIRTKLIKNEK